MPTPPVMVKRVSVSQRMPSDILEGERERERESVCVCVAALQQQKRFWRLMGGMNAAVGYRKMTATGPWRAVLVVLSPPPAALAAG